MSRKLKTETVERYVRDVRRQIGYHESAQERLVRLLAAWERVLQRNRDRVFGHPKAD